MSRILQSASERRAETHPLTWRLHDDQSPVLLDEYRGTQGYDAVTKALEQHTYEQIPLAEASEGAYDGGGKALFFVSPSFHGNVTKRYRGGTARKIWRFEDGADEGIHHHGLLEQFNRSGRLSTTQQRTASNRFVTSTRGVYLDSAFCFFNRRLTILSHRIQKGKKG